MNGPSNFSVGSPGWLMDNDFGWKARLGLITPSKGWTVEHEWPRLLPRGVSYLVTRIPLKATTPEELLKMGEHAIEGARLLASSKVDILCYGCTIETILKGLEYDKTLTEELQKVAGVPAKTMAGGVVDALRELKAQKVAVVTPYVEEINRLEKAFFEKIGFEVVYEKGLGISETLEIGKISPAAVYRLGKEGLSKAPQADILFLSCGNLRTIEILSALEKDTGKPVISSNQALLWSALRMAGVKEPIIGYGSLLERPR